MEDFQWVLRFPPTTKVIINIWRKYR